MLAGMGTREEGHIRFRRSQAGLLDALLAAQPEATFDSKFALIRDELRQFQGVPAAPQPDGFVGRLRDYQREGIGWMDFLRRFSFGGCLADDMGVGKTAQVLALLENRRELRAGGATPGPSLVVAPRSLIFNWKQEAERFTPHLRVLDYTGLNRSFADLSACDLILTTYGTVRRDAARLKDVPFDYVVLDEAQAVKNANTESAKSVRLLRGEHRLALSGTPVENHLGELWSLFEFLNPGMLGAASVFKLTSGAGRQVDEGTRQLLAHALRPFILRRTKEQVVRELPAKTEQTIYCELERPQRKLYNELRDHYREALLRRIERQGLAKSKIMVLEALLRLRQAACHPGLIDVKRSGEASAKLDALHEQLKEVLEAGHKALVFSQFTSLLKIVRNRLGADGVTYEYLDGKTRDRQTCVERFQKDPDCKVFLVSLKAGGLGLNLTAAEYVFLLDPWWNPAVEAQAVDRAHRIGQTRAVFAYRLIARDTVEEKVLDLQKTKRDLANAIIGEDNALVRNLRREDLELLLS
jgi:SNF2 family DNA or RNA helicase